jgi:hypothetical protein
VVRTRGATALGKLISLSTRVDPLGTELLAGATTEHETPGVQQAMLEALYRVLKVRTSPS